MTMWTEHKFYTSTGQALCICQDNAENWLILFNSNRPLFEDMVLAFGATQDEAIKQAVAVFRAAELALMAKKSRKIGRK